MLDAPGPVEAPAPLRGTAESFRLLAARLRRRAPADPLPEPVPAPSPLPPPDPGAAAAALLDIVWGAVDLPPQERSMAGDTLLLLLPRLPHRDLGMLAERVAAMEQPPPLLVSRLARDTRPEVGGVMLERSVHLSLGDMLAASGEGDLERLRLLARRRNVPAVVGDHIVRFRDLPSLLALLRNPGAEISFTSFLALSQMTAEHPGLQAPLTLRSDLPLAVALDLFWRLPPELRRVVIARFLSDSATLSRILALALAAGEGPALLEGPPSQAAVEAAVEPLFSGRREAAAQDLARLAGVSGETVERILSDDGGEALVVLLKALGLGRSRFDDVLDHIRAAGGLLKQVRAPEDLKGVFDALSFTKARVLLTYWDWFTRRAGPYAPAG